MDGLIPSRALRGVARAAGSPPVAVAAVAASARSSALIRSHWRLTSLAVRAANAKFRRRFASVERGAAAQGVALRDLDFDALDALWDAAKAGERTA